MGRDKRTSKAGRDPGGFVAIPWSVLDAPAYQALSVHARALLVEMARQLRGDNNGALLCSRAYMASRGWKSVDMTIKARDELIAAKFLYQTVMGHRPNKASWYAVTWQALDRINGFDPGAAETFQRSAYRTSAPLPVKPDRQALFDRWKKTDPLYRPTVQKPCA
jgi:hypothetical protein